jgi:lysozyme
MSQDPDPETIPAEHLPEAPTEVLGLDISHHNQVDDWSRVLAAGIQFAIIRVSHGGKLDRKFVEHFSGARAAGLVVGAYHFYEPKDEYPTAPPANVQARVFLDALRSVDLLDVRAVPGLLPPVLDAEEGRPGASNLLTWLDVVEDEVHLCPWIYTMIGWWSSAIGDDDRFSRYPAWIADWSPPLDIPRPWADAIVWQHTNKCVVDGIRHPVDVNRFYGSTETLNWMSRSLVNDET